jgi:transposase-like protein
VLFELDNFIKKLSHSYPKVCRNILENKDMLTFYDFPKPIRQFIRTCNDIESYNSILKRSSKKRILFNGEDNASLVIVQVIAKYNNDQNKRIVPFINELSEKERTELGFNIYVN